MKQLIRILSFSLFVLTVFAISTAAHAGFNENVAGQDCLPAVGIAQNGQPIQAGCAAYQQQAYATAPGQSFDVRLYYRNTGPTDATNVRLGMTASSSTGNFNAFLTSSAGGVQGTANLTFPNNTYLEFNGAKVYQRQGTNNPVVIKQITTLSELANFSIPTIPSYLKCLNTGNSFCYQGILVATFTVKQDAPTPQTCTDPNAANFGGPLPCVPKAPQTCTDPNALNFGGPLPCVPRPPQQQCVITQFVANPNNIVSGGSSMLSWSTTGCTSATIYPLIGQTSLSGSQSVTPAASTVYTLQAYGVNSTSATAIVTVGAPPVRPVCSDGIDNDGDGKIDAADPGCYVNGTYDATRMSEYDAPAAVAPSVSTLAATSITSTSCKLNGIVRINTASATTAYFKYGTSSGNLIYTTTQSNVGTTTGSYQFAETLTGLTPSTTYYYRLVSTNSFGTNEGELRSCTTRSNTVVVTQPTPPVTRTVVRQILPTEERIIANSAPSLLFLRIDDRREDLTCGDVVDYQVVYKNVSALTLQDAVLEVQLPAGMRYVKSSGGGTYSETTRTVTFAIGAILPGQEDARFIQVDVNCGEVDATMLVATASMVYTNPTTTAQEEAVAYDLDRFFGANDRRGLTGAAIFGAGFLPGTLVGWLILILIILGLAYLVRLFVVPPENRRTITRSTTTTTHLPH